jgi:uncharacterized membrane protein
MKTIKLEWRRQFASSRSLRILVLAAVGVLAFCFALFLWWFVGAWLVLPFAGIEIGCVAIAFWWIEQSAGDFDCVEIADASVTVLSCRRRKANQVVLKRDWLTTELGSELAGGRRSVRLRQAGQSVELLEFLPMREQHRALRDLRAALATRL